MSESVFIRVGNFEVEIMADSYVRVPEALNPTGYHRLITVQCIFPRMVLAELNTHRQFSRNSASSRAIPVAKMVQAVLHNPFIPGKFPKTHKGMQANKWFLSGTDDYDVRVAAWLELRDKAVEGVILLDELEVSKQIANRGIEPFLMHKVILSATEWENFIALRAHSDAQHEIRLLAEMILAAINLSEPNELTPGEWHLPFGDRLDPMRLAELFQEVNKDASSDKALTSVEELSRMVTVARCTRVSYDGFEGKDDYKKDIELYYRLVEQGHWSPFEHVARAMTAEEYKAYCHGYPDRVEYGWCGNYRGLIQLRRTFPHSVESRPDPRIRPVTLS